MCNIITNTIIMWSMKVHIIYFKVGMNGGSVVKNLPANAGDSFDPWDRNFPHVVEQLSLWATTMEPVL